MMNFKNPQAKIWLAALWMGLCLALVIWWWSLGLSELKALPSEKIQAKYNMLMWEGLFFVGLIVLGGFSLIYLLRRDVFKQNQLKVFFAAFSHDLKTSISRIRLQVELLEEQKEWSQFSKIFSDLKRLDLQLENSLYLAQGSNPGKKEYIALRQVIHSLREDFSDLEIGLEKDFEIFSEFRVLQSLLRNIFFNAVQHGKATRIGISLGTEKWSTLVFQDNGSLKGESTDFAPSPARPRGHGLGLWLCRQWMQSMGGRLEARSNAEGFSVHLHFSKSQIREPLT